MHWIVNDIIWLFSHWNFLFFHYSTLNACRRKHDSTMRKCWWKRVVKYGTWLTSGHERVKVPCYLPISFSGHLEISISNSVLGPSPCSLWWLKVPHVGIQFLNCLCRQLIINSMNLIELLSLCLQFLAHLYSYINLIRFTSTSTSKHITSSSQKHIKSIQ